MRHPWQSVLRSLALVAGFLAITAPARAELSVSVGFFYDDLAPYGRWVSVDGYGECWHPAHVRADWRPYLDGRWVYTDYGWTWVADEEWGWAPYHYGRWLLDPIYGWVWVPGDEWAPAWVSWHYGDGYVGWAPLPPRARWVAGIGLDFGGAQIDYEIGPQWYTFVPETRFVDVPVRRYAVPVARNHDLFRTTRLYTDYAVARGAVVNRGVPVQVIERATRRPVPELRLRAAEATGPGRIRGREVSVFRPAVHVTPEISRQRQERRASVRPGPDHRGLSDRRQAEQQARESQRLTGERERQAEITRQQDERRLQQQHAQARAEQQRAARARQLSEQQAREHERQARENDRLARMAQQQNERRVQQQQQIQARAQREQATRTRQLGEQQARERERQARDNERLARTAQQQNERRMQQQQQMQAQAAREQAARARQQAEQQARERERQARDNERLARIAQQQNERRAQQQQQMQAQAARAEAARARQQAAQQQRAAQGQRAQQQKKQQQEKKGRDRQ